MATRYIRHFSFRDSLTDAEVLEELKFFLDQFAPALAKIPGVREIHLFSGAGALRADLTISVDIDNAGVYDSALESTELRGLLGRLSGAWDMKSASHSFRQEVTPQFIQALSGTS